MRRTIKRVQALSAQVGEGYSSAINVSDFQHIVFSTSAVASANQLTKLQGAIGETTPVFSTARIVGNEWDYVGIIDMQTSTAVSGDTGITQSGVDVRQFSVNVDGLDWISFHNVSGATGSVTVNLVAYSNQ